MSCLGCCFPFLKKSTPTSDSKKPFINNSNTSNTSSGPNYFTANNNSNMDLTRFNNVPYGASRTLMSYSKVVQLAINDLSKHKGKQEHWIWGVFPFAYTLDHRSWNLTATTEKYSFKTLEEAVTYFADKTFQNSYILVIDECRKCGWQMGGDESKAADSLATAYTAAFHSKDEKFKEAILYSVRDCRNMRTQISNKLKNPAFQNFMQMGTEEVNTLISHFA